MTRIRRPFPLVTGPVPRIRVSPGNTVLLVQDMQRFLADPGLGLAAVAAARGVDTEFIDYAEQLAAATATIAALGARLRGVGVPVWHTRWVHAETRLQQAVEIVPAADDPAAAIVDALAPADGEPVFDKPGLSAFSSPELRAACAEQGIETVILAGTILELGIQATALQAMDRGIAPLLVSDGCATLTHGIKEITLDGLSCALGKVRPWEELWYSLQDLAHTGAVDV